MIKRPQIRCVETRYSVHMFKACLLHDTFFATFRKFHLTIGSAMFSPTALAGFRQPKSSCFRGTLIYHTVIPLISAASNISILKKSDLFLPCKGERMCYLVHVIGNLCQSLFHLLHIPPLFLKLKTKLHLISSRKLEHRSNADNRFGGILGEVVSDLKSMK